MKFSRIYIVCILLFLLLVFLSEYRMPRHFRWEPSFNHADKQPFGCYVFDSVLSASLSQDYTVNSQTLYQLRDLKRPHGILIVAEDVSEWGDTEVRSAFHLATAGHRLLLACGSMGRRMEDTLRTHSYFSGSSTPLIKYVKQGLGRDTIEWFADDCYGRRDYYYYPQLLNHELYLNTDSIDCRVLSHIPSSRSEYSTVATAVTYPIGKGSITWVCTPLVFTNYGMLDGNNHEYIFRLLSQMGDLPVIRTEAYMPAFQEAQQTPLRYVLSQRPLRWALYLSLLTILIAMVLGFRRRQRVIPLVEPPRNHLLEFVQLIGTLYYQRRDCRQQLLNQSEKYHTIWKKTTKSESPSPTSPNG